MEFNFGINNLLAETITKLDCNVTPARRNAEGYSQNELRSQLLAVIDKMGDASSKAQGLYSVITTGRKLQLSDHILYTMKDASGNGGRGSAVGILKIGPKKLFVYSHHGTVHEMEPMCVLDFYVHESRQRMGCGRKLFDYMLQDMGVKAAHLAIDKPSFKFSQFLKKHYNLRAEIPQVNNFVVFEGFFNDRPDAGVKKRSGYNGRPPHHPNRKREQLIEEGFVRQNTYNGYGMPPLHPSVQNLGLGFGGGSNSRPPSGSSVKTRSASVLSTPRKELIDLVDLPRNGQLRPISATDVNGIEVRSNSRNITGEELKSKGNQIYSRHINHSDSPNAQLQGSRPPSGKSPIVNGLNLTNGVHNRNQNANYSAPPLLRRGATADEYSVNNNLNMHQDYQGRRGHLKVNQGYEQPIRNPFLSRDEEKVTNTGWQPPRDQPSWTVFSNEPNYLTIATRNYTHTRLW